MTAPSPDLPMTIFLLTLKVHGMETYNQLIEDGYPSKLIIYKAISLSEKGYCDYGTTPKYCWLTPKGEEYLRGPRPDQKEDK